MEIERIELTIEDILNLHSEWIKQRYVTDGKTEEEIVSLLSERGLSITLAQIQRCVRDWNLTPQPARNTTGVLPVDSLLDDWEVIPSPLRPESATQNSYTPSNPDEMDIYTTRPLPSLPSTVKKSRSRIQRLKSSHTDRLKLNSLQAASSEKAQEIQTTLDSMTSGPTPLQMYTEDEQGHERIAIGLERIPPFPRSGDRKEGRVRCYSQQRGRAKDTHRRKKRSDSPKEEKERTPDST